MSPHEPHQTSLGHHLRRRDDVSRFEAWDAAAAAAAAAVVSKACTLVADIIGPTVGLMPEALNLLKYELLGACDAESEGTTA